MRILRNILYIIVVVVGIVLASANMTPVRFVYLPGVAFLQTGDPAAADVPLALLLLAFLLLGALVAGTGTFVEHVRLRFLVRRNAKVVKALRADLEKARAEVDEARSALEARDSDLASEQARAKRAEEAEAKALAAAEQERIRADEAASALAPPPGA